MSNGLSSCTLRAGAMGSHVDRPEWQSFERRMRERYLVRRRRIRLRWMAVIAGAILFGLSGGPSRVIHQTITDHATSSAPAARRESRPSTVTVLRVALAPMVIREQAPSDRTVVETAAFLHADSLQIDLPRPQPLPANPPPQRAEPLPPEPPPRSTAQPELPSSSARPEAPLSSAPPEPPIEAVVAAVPPTDARPPAPTASAITVQEDVRRVIERYRDAYERLDATAAHAIWPGVDEVALARAFSGLASQRIEFERCDIWRDAQAAFASCVGWASYVPKVGSARNEVPRSWHFRLRRRSAGWAIESAEVR